VGFVSYNILLVELLTDKYLDVPATYDDSERTRALQNVQNLEVVWMKFDGEELYTDTEQRLPRKSLESTTESQKNME